MEPQKSENGETEKQANHLVLDSSVIIKWFSQEEDTPKALKIRERFLKGSINIIVPDIQIYEIANALRYNKTFQESEVKEAIKSLIDIGLSVFVPTKEVIECAVELSFKFGISFYDAYFVALAKKLNIPLITADEKLYKKLNELKFVKFLKSFEI